MVSGFTEKATFPKRIAASHLLKFFPYKFPAGAQGKGMRDPKRILAKLLPPATNLAEFEATGEPLETTIEILRDVVKCRKIRNWLRDSFDLEVAVNGREFSRLLEIPEINFIETPNRDLEVDVVSLKDIRQREDPVTIGNLNSVLRELYRSLFTINESKRKNHPELLLAQDISPDLVKTVSEATASLPLLNGQVTGYLLTAGKVRQIEDNFKRCFPNSTKAHPLRKNLEAVVRELTFYHGCLEVNEKWQPLNLDLLKMIREDALTAALENIQELGNLLWNLVYKNPPVQRSTALAGIHFEDIRSLFDEEKAPVNNF